MKEISIIRKQHTKALSMTIGTIWISLVCLIMPSTTLDFLFLNTHIAYAQGNQTERLAEQDPNVLAGEENVSNTEDEDDDNGSQDGEESSQQGEEERNNDSNTVDDNESQVGVLTDPLLIECEINPDSPQCCPTGENEECNIPITGQVTISQIRTEPQDIKVGDEFKIQATIENNMNVPITFRGDECGSPLDIKYDEKVDIYHAFPCQIESTETLNRQDSVTVESKGYEIVTAQSAGNSEVDVIFNYRVEGDPNQSILTKSFSFDISEAVQGSDVSTDLPVVADPDPEREQGVTLSDLKINRLNSNTPYLSTVTFFTFSATVKNNLNETISYDNSCSHPSLSTRNSPGGVFVDYPLACNTAENVITLMPGQEGKINGPGNYKAIIYNTSGQKTLTLMLHSISEDGKPTNNLLAEKSFNFFVRDTTPRPTDTSVGNNPTLEIDPVIDNDTNSNSNSESDTPPQNQTKEPKAPIDGTIGPLDGVLDPDPYPSPVIEISDFQLHRLGSETLGTITPGIEYVYSVKITNKGEVPVFFYNQCSETQLGYRVSNIDIHPSDRNFCDVETINKMKLNPGESTSAWGPGETRVLEFLNNSIGEKEIELNLTYNIGNPSGPQENTNWFPFTLNVSSR